MPNARKVIYSLRIYIELDKKGFKPIATMPNGHKPHLMCWVYEKTDEFVKALDEIMEVLS